MIIQTRTGRFKGEIGDFVTKLRSRRGFCPASWEGGQKKDAPDRKMRQNVGFHPQPHVSLAAPFVPFGISRRGRRGVPVLRGSRRGRIRTRGGVRCRRVAQAAPRSGGARQVRRRTRTTVRSAGTVGFSTGPPKRRRKPTLQVTFSRSLYRSPGSPSFSPVDESPGLQFLRARAALSRSCARDGAEILERLGGMTPSSSCASVDEGGQALEGGGHGPRGGNWRSGLLRRLARRGSASPRRRRGSALGVQRDGQWRGRHSPENVEFWAGNRKNDVESAARRRGRPCPESAARRWSLSPRPTTGRFSGSSSPTSRQSTSFMPANISARLPSMRSRPTGTTSIASPCATHGVDKVGDTLSPRQGDDENGGRGS